MVWRSARLVSKMKIWWKILFYYDLNKVWYISQGFSFKNHEKKYFTMEDFLKINKRIDPNNASHWLGPLTDLEPAHTWSPQTKHTLGSLTHLDPLTKIHTWTPHPLGTPTHLDPSPTWTPEPNHTLEPLTHLEAQANLKPHPKQMQIFTILVEVE